MLAFFRRLINSKAGLIVTFIVLGLIALAFASGDVSSLRTRGLAALGGSDDVATVGAVHVTAPELTQQVGQSLQTFRQQQPTLNMAQFVAGGGYEATLERLVNGLALEQFGHDQGLVISRRAIDGQIASLPGLQGPDGQFDPNLFRQVLAERKLTEASVRADIGRDIMTQLLTARLLRPGQAPQQLALPYANLSLEKRAGEIAFVPSAAMPAAAPPTDAEVQAFYARNLARYTVPERRLLRYALVTPEQVRARATPSDAEIAQAYNSDSKKYAATEKRSVTQVVVLDQAGAQALAAKVKGGASLAAAAAAAGLSPSAEASVDKATLATRTSPALADAAFAAAKGAVVGPVRGGLGYAVARVDAIEQVAGRTLAQAHDEIAAELTKRKTADALNAVHDAIDDKLGGNATFDELVADQKLQAASAGPLLANGVDPAHPDAKPDPALAPLVQAAFQMQDGDDPQMVPTAADGSFAVVALGRIVAAAPRPLAEARAQVVKDVAADRARLAARRVAGELLAKVNGGQTLAQAWAATGLKAAPPHPLAAARDDLDKAQGPAKAPLALLFAMPRGATRLLEASGGAGWAVIRLDRIIPGDASREPDRIAALRAAFGQVLGREYLEQFAQAARAAVGVKTNPATIARVKADLLKGNGVGDAGE